MTDHTNVISVENEDLAWINQNVPGKSKKARLKAMLEFYKTNKGPVNPSSSPAAAAGGAKA